MTLSGGPEWDPIQNKVAYYKAGVAIIDLGSVNWSECRKAPEKCNIKIPNPIAVADFTPFDTRREELIKAGVRILAPAPNVAVSDALHSESITISQDSRTAWVPLPRNNAIAVMDLQMPHITDVFALGSKDHSKPGNGFDASDKDGKINIATWPISSFYEAGHIAVVGGGAQRFLVMASQGDPWDEDWFREKFRLGGDLPSYPPLPLNPAEFPNASVLQLKNNLGRLNVTALSGDTNGDGMFEKIYMVGSRSFSIRDLNDRLIFDSGDDFEQITAAALPNNFNCSEDSNTFDDRSDDRGPEPKHIAVGAMGGREYAFIGFEMVSGIIVYDITDRFAPRFQVYFNNRNFNVEPRTVCGGKPGHQLDTAAQITCPEAGDLSTEGFVFIPQHESPIHTPLLAVAHETSDSTTLYPVDKIAR